MQLCADDLKNKKNMKVLIEPKVAKIFRFIHANCEIFFTSGDYLVRNVHEVVLQTCTKLC